MIYHFKRSDHTSKNKVKSFCESFVFIEEEWFDDMNIAVDATFLTTPLKREKSIFNQKVLFPHDTKQRKWEIAMSNGWNTHVSRYCVKNMMEMFVSKGNLSVYYQSLLDYHRS